MPAKAGRSSRQGWALSVLLRVHSQGKGSWLPLLSLLACAETRDPACAHGFLPARWAQEAGAEGWGHSRGAAGAVCVR